MIIYHTLCWNLISVMNNYINSKKYEKFYFILNKFIFNRFILTNSSKFYLGMLCWVFFKLFYNINWRINMKIFNNYYFILGTV